ncbi:MAG: GlxA family transcriptional regulator [Sporichthyaceae bacterium]
MRIGVVVRDGCFGSGVSALLDILGTAESVRAGIEASIPAVDVAVVASTRRVTASNGLVIKAAHTLGELGDFDVVVVAGLGTLTGPDTEANLDSAGGQAMVRALARVDPARTRFAAACTGVFALAETGLLDGRRATTTWFLAPAFLTRYPDVRIDLERMLVTDGTVLTAGAAFAHIDLALGLLQGISPTLTQHVARLLLLDERPSQAAFVSYDLLQHDDALVRAFEQHVRTHLDATFDTGEVARAIGTSRRTLERRTREVVGLSPLAIVQRLRLERAQHLRRTTALSTEAIAHRVGYANAETLRSLERRANRGGTNSDMIHKHRSNS